MKKNKEISVRNLSAIFSQKYEKIVTKSVIHRIKHQKLQLRHVAKLPEHCAQFGSKTPFSEDWFKTFVKIFIYNFKHLNARLEKLCSRQAIPKISREDYFLF